MSFADFHQQQYFYSKRKTHLFVNNVSSEVSLERGLQILTKLFTGMARVFGRLQNSQNRLKFMRRIIIHIVADGNVSCRCFPFSSLSRNKKNEKNDDCEHFWSCIKNCCRRKKWKFLKVNSDLNIFMSFSSRWWWRK